MKWVKHSLRFLLVTVGIVVLTSFGIDATDTLKGSQTALSLVAKNALEESCPVGMVEVSLSNKTLCVDQYENSAGKNCPHQGVQSGSHTQDNLNELDCSAVSEKDKDPWVFVSYHQAKNICAGRGARLPTPSEWYEAALSTRESECNLDGQVSKTGEFSGCQSARGMFDMVGNVWEWVDAEVNNGQYEGRTLPTEGYVTEADMAGVAILTDKEGSEMFGKDYFWHSEVGIYAMMRGGYYGSEGDGGLYAVHTEVKPAFSGAAIGFRCVMNR